MRKLTATLCLTLTILIGSVGVSYALPQCPIGTHEDMQTGECVSTNDGSNAGPSFSCQMASTPTEYAICTSATLSALDRDLAAVYKVAKGNLENVSDNSTTLRDEQRKWNKKRSSMCADDVECLSRMYQERIDDLAADASAQFKLGQMYDFGDGVPY